MRLVRLSTILHNIKTQIGIGHVSGFSSYSTTTRTATRSKINSLWKGSMYNLYRRITPIGDRAVSIVPLLDQWVEEGGPVDRKQLQIFIRKLRSYKRFAHALEISMWMTDKRHFELTSGDVAIRLDLIAKVHGIKQAENYFSNVPKNLRGCGVYAVLLNCYASTKSVEKAEIIMQQMRDLGLAMRNIDYNSMLNFYYQIRNYEKLDSLMHEMEEKGIGFDKYTLGIRLSAYAAASDGEGIDKTVAMMESDPNIVLDCTIYASAASGYAKAGNVNKALAMLKKSEGLILDVQATRAYDFLITQYAACGNKDDVLRVWELYKNNLKVYNRGYFCVIHSVLKFDDLERAEKIFEEWESLNLQYDFRIPNFLISAYCRKGLLQKAVTLINKATLMGGKPNVRTWYTMATGYLQKNQTQKAVEAMKKALVICETQTKWRPSKECLAACLEYFKEGREIEGAEHFLKLLVDKDIISVDLQDRLLNNIRNG